MKLFPIPLNPPLNGKYSIPIHDKSQRGTSPEQRWKIGWKKSNIEARPPLIAYRELDKITSILKGELKGD